jgi:hypothetical protein
MDTKLPPSSEEQIKPDTNPELTKQIASTIKYVGICGIAAALAAVILVVSNK